MLRIYLLNGVMMDTAENLHSHLYLQFGLPSHYGRNLDALWDCLCEKEPGCIVFQRAECVENGLLLPLVGLLLNLVRKNGAWQLQLSTGRADCHSQQPPSFDPLFGEGAACPPGACCAATQEPDALSRTSAAEAAVSPLSLGNGSLRDIQGPPQQH